MSSKAPPVPGTTYLTGTQAAQILEKLKVIRNKEGQTIKIQTIQTNPQTGAKQIVAIPIGSAPATVGKNLSVSPMKTMRNANEGALLTQGRTIKISSPRTSGYPGQVSLVKAGGQSSSFQSTSIQAAGGVVPAVAGIQSLPTTTVGGVTAASGTTLHRVTLTPQKTGPAVVAAQRFPRQQLQFEVATSAAKRPAELDLLEFSDSKRRKTEKGWCLLFVSRFYSIYKEILEN